MNAPVAIQVEDISKLYRLGVIGHNSLATDLSGFLKRLFSSGAGVQSNENDLWALKDINFSVNKGEVLGVIGKNGSGKSTLLKIVSQITSPTTGTVKINGRVASLLEVGTGFHPQLTGRENIYLNGTILGMKKAEIAKKFDEIVEFSGVAKFIDTPVKRYSSGMYVRLAFAVAAHLEPEILIVDEVLAVGDAEFQNKCLGKMQDVSKQGRTILFVSHNMAAINNLCSRVLVLKNGKLQFDGETEKGVSIYLGTDGAANFANPLVFDNKENDKPIQIYRIGLKNSGGDFVSKFDYSEEVVVEYWLNVHTLSRNLFAGVNISNARGECLFSTHDIDMNESSLNGKVGLVKYFFSIPPKLLKPGHYSLYFACAISDSGIADDYGGFGFEIVDFSSRRAEKQLYWINALVAPEIKWKIDS